MSPACPYLQGTSAGELRVVSADGSVSSGNNSDISSIAGRLEVCYGGQWGGVCAIDFNDYEASIACRQLGYTFGRAIPSEPEQGECMQGRQWKWREGVNG